MLIWLTIPGLRENMSECEKNSIKCKFIDSIISCRKSNEVEKYIKFQFHRHTFTCYKSTKDREYQNCRFNIPYPPIRETVILEPFSSDSAAEDSKKQKNRQKDPLELKYEEKFIQLKRLLRDSKYKEVELSIDEIFEKLEINSYNDYLLILRSSIRRPTVFLKRKFSERRISPYNPILLQE